MSEPRASPISLEAAVLAYLALLPPEARKEQQLQLNRFVRWMSRERPVQALTAPDVAAFAESSLSAGVNDQAKLLQPVKEFLAYAKKKGLTTSNLAVHVKLSKAPARRSAGAQRKGVQQVVLTAEGFQRLKEEAETLRAQRPHLAEAIRLARADGDLSENAPYHAAREQQGQVEARIRTLEATLAVAVVDVPRSDAVKADLGATVVLVEEPSGREARYLLVAPNEARPAAGKLSVASPLGRSLVNRSQGEVIEVTAPAGVTRYRLARVER